MFKKTLTALCAAIIVLILFMIQLPIPGFATGTYLVTLDVGDKVVLGRTKTIDVKITNDGNSWIYNIGADLLMDNGLEIVREECSVKPATAEYQVAAPLSKQKVTWQSLVDLAPGQEYTFTISVKALEKHKDSDGTDILGNSVNIGEIFNGSIDLKAADLPENLNTLSVNRTFNLTVVPFEVQFKCPEKSLKGAGNTTDTSDDYAPAVYQYTVELINNTVYNSSIDLNATIGNGIQPVNFSQAPDVNNINADDTTAVAWSGYHLSAGATENITFDSAIFNKTTVNGVVNSGAVISDGTTINSTLNYTGNAQGDLSYYSGNLTATIKAKDITLTKTVTPNTGIGYGTAIKYTLKIATNQYYGASNIVVTDVLKDGLDFVSENNNTNFSYAHQGGGDTLLIWNPAYASINAASSEWIEIYASVKYKWNDDSDIVANDTIENSATVQGECHFEEYSSNPQDTSTKEFSIATPSIQNQLLAVNGGAPVLVNGVPSVAIGDVLEYKLTYDASAIAAKQKNVTVKDFFPVGTGYASSEPNSLLYYEDGVQVPAWSDLDGTPGIDESNPNQSYFKADFSLINVNKKYEVIIKLIVKDVPEIVNGRQEYNTLIAWFANTAGEVQSLRQDVKLQYCASALGITKTASKSTVIIGGETIGFTLTVTNNGDATVYDVDVCDALPAEYTNRNNGALPAGVTFNSGIYTISSIPAGQSMVLVYTADIVNPIGAGCDLTNSATIQKYKRMIGGSYHSDNPIQQANVTMSAATVNISLAIVDNSRNNLSETALSKGDWLVYHIAVTLPNNVSIYNSKIINTLTEGQTVAANSVYSDYNPTTNVGTNTTYTNDNNASGNKITLVTGTKSGGETVHFYIKATINNYTTPYHNNGAIIEWSDQLTGGTSHSTTSNSLTFNVKQPDLDVYLDMSPSTLTMVKGDTPTFRLRIRNNKAITNTAYNFAPYIRVPSYVTLSGFQKVDTGTWNGHPQDLVATTSTPTPGTTQYTLPLIPQLMANGDYYIVFKATFTGGERPCGDSFSITGYTGSWYTTPENVISLPTDSSGLTVNVPSATITNTIFNSDNGGSTTEIRPYDTVTYRVNVKIPKGTKVYQPRLHELFPADFTLDQLVDQNGVVHDGSDITWPYVIDSNSVSAVGADINYSFYLKFRARSNGNFGGVNRYTAANTASLLWNLADGSNQKVAGAPAVNIDVVQPAMVITAFSSNKTTLNSQGETVSFSGSIRNNGQSSANCVKLIATIPEGINIDESSITAGGIKADNRHIEWNFASISKNDAKNISFNLAEDGDMASSSNGNVQFSIIEYFSTYDVVNSKKYSSVSQNININQPPLIPDYATTTLKNTMVTGTAVGTDIDGGLLTYQLHQGPAHGTCTVNANGTWSYTPDSGYVGSDTYQIKVNDGQGNPVGYDISTVEINVVNVESVSVTPSVISVLRGSTQDFDATVTGQNNPAQTVTWSVTGGHTGTSIDNTGLLTIDELETADNLTVTATSTVDNTRAGTATVTVRDITYPLTITATVGGSITTGSSGNYSSGTAILIAATAAPNYSFQQWTSSGGGIFVSTGSAVTTFSMPGGAATISAIFTYNNSGSSGSGSNLSSGSGNSPATEISTTNNAISTTTVEAKVDTEGKAIATITTSQLMNAINKSVAMKVTTPIATITFDNRALDTILQAASGDVRITAYRVDVSTLSDEIRKVIGNRPVINFSVTSGNSTISQFGGNVAVTVPYTPQAEEDISAIIVYYINAEGKLEIVSECAYNLATRTITFVTDHFSRYAIGYNKVTFTDVAANAEYSNAVSFVAARGITSGTGNCKFSPEDKLTRGQFLVMIMKAYGLKPDETAKDNFSDVGDTYYTGYLAVAKRMGLTGGIGNNKYAPEKTITRQEMFTLLYKVLKLRGDIPTGTSGKALSDFSDGDQVSSWAKDAMELFTKAGIMIESGGRLNPAQTVNRAEMSKVLFSLLSK